MTQRIHADLIKAWADGADIQRREVYCRYNYNANVDTVKENWVDEPNPTWAFNCEYRIKPRPVPDVISYVSINYPHKTQWFEHDNPMTHDCIKITRNYYTGELTSAELNK